MTQVKEHGGEIVFNSAQGILSDGTIKLRLNKQGTRCLEYLLLHPDEIISKERFITNCWEKYGNVVTDNSVRQTFFQLRRSLDDIGAPSNTLLTVPKRGYKLTPGIITQHSSLAEIPGSMQDSLSKPATTLTSTVPIMPISISKKFISISVIFACLCFVIGSVVRYNLLVKKVTYSEINKTNNLTFYQLSDSQYNNSIRIPEIINNIPSLSIDTASYNKFYINPTEGRNLSLFVCQKPIEEDKNMCIPVIIIGEKE